jgi:hypothetical protein
MGPRQFKACVFSTKPSDDLTGPGPPLAGKKTSSLKIRIRTHLASVPRFQSLDSRRFIFTTNCS